MDMATTLITRFLTHLKFSLCGFTPVSPQAQLHWVFLLWKEPIHSLSDTAHFLERLEGKEIPDLAWLYQRRFVPLCSHPALRQSQSNPDSHRGHTGNGTSFTSTPSLTLKETTPAPPPLLTLPWQQMPSLLSLSYSSKSTCSQTCSLHAGRANVPLQPPESLSHPAPQKDHNKSLHHPCKGSSPGSTTGESLHRRHKNEQHNLQRGSYTCHLELLTPAISIPC